MQQRRRTPLIVVAALLAVTAIILAVSVDVYDELFWTRFGWSLVAIVIASVGFFRAMALLADKPAFAKAIAELALYAIAMVVLLAAVGSAKLMFVVALAQSGLYCLMLFLSGGALKRY